MSTSRAAVAELYGKIAESENTRLATHPMEREITLRAIRHHLSGFGSAADSRNQQKRIADVGGGPGKLAFALADEGHHVDLVDLSPGLIDLARQEQDNRRANTQGDEHQALLASIGVGDALDQNLPLAAGSYDAVLLLGPLYHLLEEAERVAAVRNALNLARPDGGLVFCAFVSVEAHLRDLAVREPQRLVEQREFYAAYLQNGRYARHNSTLGTTSQSFHTNSSDARDFLQRHFAAAADLVGLRSTEGILGGGLDRSLVGAEPEVVQAWADLMFEQYSEQERHLGGADHLLAVLRRK
ncbi:methyltransferase type 11 [Microdochium trichocladiopsis]|uniref:Methyltransferase type 11 n=1 Tax=Microdochium trichocladiopsis TaxID=1682393 RepID=A0A9P8Y1C7_9PEZI|nr:methyltransferase type 11 [Microdochium trichocladiopsis]KAH7025027.1 methyltransferase type 11 [Microdochium trichocladiopsis]